MFAKRPLLALMCTVSMFLATALFAAEKEEVSVSRDPEGAVVADNVRLDIPEDRKIYKLASNVIRVEDKDLYADRKITGIMTSFEAKLNEIEARLTKLENAAKAEAEQAQQKQSPVSTI